jgi:hypothetical protein
MSPDKLVLGDRGDLGEVVSVGNGCVATGDGRDSDCFASSSDSIRSVSNSSVGAFDALDKVCATATSLS